MKGKHSLEENEMKRTFVKEAILKTSMGSFYVTITPHTNRNKLGQNDSYTISLGSPRQKCVQINVPSEESGETEGTLIWVEAKEDCFLSSPKKDKLTQHLVNLGFSVAKDINPLCHRYLFDDCSRIECEISETKKQQMPMGSFHIAFYEETWYEKYFGAKLVRDHEVYLERKRNFFDSAKKPKSFQFVQRDLQEILTPMFEEAHTWHDFFQAISRRFGKKKCTAVYPWILSALIHIFEGNMFDSPKWYIDLLDNKLAEKTPFIPFISYNVKQKGGKRFTRKRVFYTNSIKPHYYVDYPYLQSVNYKTLLGI